MEPDPTTTRRAALEAAADAFRLHGGIVEAERWGSGHINETYRVVTGAGRARRRTLVQRINSQVFGDPRALMASIRRVTAHLRAKVEARGLPDPDRRVMTLLETRDGDVLHHRAENDTWWRAYVFVDGARSYDETADPRVARAAAYAFGSFQRDLADLAAPRLTETIPFFHHTPRRLDALREVARADVQGRAKGALAELDFALEREALARVLLDAHDAGEVPERITHNDTKINNVLFDDASGEAICVIDLDTVMPGLGLYDFGDMVRTSTSPTPEDERDLARIHADPRLFEALADGYLQAMGNVLTPRERELLPLSGRLITYELGVRMLTDYLQGDTYFRTSRPEQNLDRARAQFALLRSLEAQDALFCRIVG